MANFFTDRVRYAFNKEMLSEYALATLGGVVYTGLPTALNMSGPGAMALGAGATIAAGFAFKSRAMMLGGFMVALVHLIYKYGSNETMKWWGRPIWSLEPNADPATQLPQSDLNDYLTQPYGYGMSDYMQLPNGYAAMALPPADPPSPSQQMNDYLTANDSTLMDDDDDLGFMGSTVYEQNGGGYDATSIFE